MLWLPGLRIGFEDEDVFGLIDTGADKVPVVRGPYKETAEFLN